MKYLKMFNESILSRREVASSIFEDLKNICIDLEHDYDFITYISPFERIEYNDDSLEHDTFEIVKNASNPNISKRLRDGSLYISFNLDLNKISSEFDNPKRLEILDNIKITLNRLTKYMQSQDYKFDIVGKPYQDVKTGEFGHTDGYWGQKSFSPFNEKRFKIMEEIRFRVNINYKSNSDHPV